MYPLLRTARARLLTPDRAVTQLAVRGFPVKDEETKQRLEAVGASFLDGFHCALEAEDNAAAAGRLDTGIATPVRGFAYEGAAMALAVLDGLTPGGGRRASRFIAGEAARHVYMGYVGIGWAYGKLPRWRWGAIGPVDPLLGWLALDGYGFYHAFFHTDRYVHDQYVDSGVHLPGRAPDPYSRHAIDQGIGRASWFVAGADPDRAATLIDRFAPDRRADLWSGMGLAATYAGAASEVELKTLWDHAGEYQPHLAQGATFGAKARIFAGLATPHTPVATAVFCGCSPEEAAAVTDRAREDLPPDGELPAYEVWRGRIRSHFPQHQLN
jgi:enediyne biosynthesis protein E3